MDGQVVFSLLMVCGIILFSILSLSLILSISSYYFVKRLKNFRIVFFITWVNFGAGVACILLD